MITYLHENSIAYMETMESLSVDTIITDPPYNLNEFTKEFIMSQMRRICRGTIIVFSPPENQWILPANQYLFWIKPISTKNTSKNYSRFVEMIFVYQNGHNIWNCDRHWSQYTNVFVDLVDDSSIHPFRKPPSLIERLVKNHTYRGDTIFDPFAGSFVLGEVCHKLGRNCLGIEKDQDVFEDTVLRLEPLLQSNHSPS